jgi:hypothetical protein
MTSLLQQAFEKASALAPDDQNAIAAWLIEELESERRWEHLFRRSEELLESLALDALKEHRRGRTESLDPETL